jgi:site-specific DNA-methyltransferase (adenine-specific)
MIAIICADARTLEADLCAARFDACITDPPYSQRVHAKTYSNGTINSGGPHTRDLGFEAIDDMLRTTIACIAATCTRWTAVFSDIDASHDWRVALAAQQVEVIRSVPWVRWSQPQLSGDRPPSGCEMITLAHARGAKRWSGPGSLTAFTALSLRGAAKYSCEKPLDLMISLVSWFSDAGEAIVDPCCGVGTTPLACKLLGRDCVAIERDAAVAARAQTRLAAPISARDRERCERWIAMQRAWLHDAPDSVKGVARYARAQADMERIESIL